MSKATSSRVIGKVWTGMRRVIKAHVPDLCVGSFSYSSEGSHHHHTSALGIGLNRFFILIVVWHHDGFMLPNGTFRVKLFLATLSEKRGFNCVEGAS